MPTAQLLNEFTGPVEAIATSLTVLSPSGLLAWTGGTVLRITGMFSWLAALGAATVSVGGQPCLTSFFVTLSIIERSAPAGVGANVTVLLHSSCPHFPASIVVPGVVKYESPTLRLVSTAGFPTSGGSTVRLLGDGFGEVADDVECMLVGCVEVPVAVWVSLVEVRFTLPAGVGVGILVRVRTRGGLLSPMVMAAVLAYNAPMLCLLLWSRRMQWQAHS